MFLYKIHLRADIPAEFGGFTPFPVVVVVVGRVAANPPNPRTDAVGALPGGRRAAIWCRDKTAWRVLG